MRKIIVDIDSTLWDFAWALEWELRSTKMPKRQEWHRWEFWKDHISKEVFWDAVKKIHLKQDAECYAPYPEAKGFLGALRTAGFHVIIASHRDDDALEPALAWLNRHGLVFDDFHVSHNKTVLFDEGCMAVVDDCPKTLDEAEHRGIIRAGLRHPWNAGTHHPLFGNLNEVYEYITKEVAIR